MTNGSRVGDLPVYAKDTLALANVTEAVYNMPIEVQAFRGKMPWLWGAVVRYSNDRGLQGWQSSLRKAVENTPSFGAEFGKHMRGTLLEKRVRSIVEAAEAGDDTDEEASGWPDPSLQKKLMELKSRKKANSL